MMGQIQGEIKLQKTCGKITRGFCQRGVLDEDSEQELFDSDEWDGEEEDY